MEPKWLEEIKERARTGASRNLGPDRRVLLAHIRELREVVDGMLKCAGNTICPVCQINASQLMIRQEPPEVQ